MLFLIWIAGRRKMRYSDGGKREKSMQTVFQSLPFG